ncbi:MAG: Cof-type HAD-IIB family hydrolase [Bacilli bacterium]|nr:Cof-type HAD-IIB family hydrolase [Bacilli bacterium]
MMIKGIVAVDLDGTLLDVAGQYSTATRDYLRKLTSAGYAVVLASGRPYRSMKAIYEDIGSTAPLICYNGALSFDPKDPSFPTLSKTFPKESIQTIFEKTRHYVHSFMAESLTYVYANQVDQRLNRYFPYAGMGLALGPLSESLRENVYTCLFNCPVELHGQLKEDCESVPGISWRSWSNSVYSELFIPSADKGDALAYIMEHLNVKKEDVYAFGDAENDITMLSKAGHPFAMKNNRVPELLSRFPQTENPVEEDGVIVELQKWIRL